MHVRCLILLVLHEILSPIGEKLAHQSRFGWGAVFGGVVAVISGTGLVGALCAWVWHVWGVGVGQRMLCGWCFLACWAGAQGVMTGLAFVVAALWLLGLLLRLGFRVRPGLVLVAVVGLVQVRRGAGGCWVAGWLLGGCR